MNSPLFLSKYRTLIAFSFNGRKNAIFANPVTYAMFYDQKVRELNGKIYYGANYFLKTLPKNYTTGTRQTV